MHITVGKATDNTYDIDLLCRAVVSGTETRNYFITPHTKYHFVGKLILYSAYTHRVCKIKYQTIDALEKSAIN